MDDNKPDIFDTRNSSYMTGLDSDARKRQKEKEGTELRKAKREAESSKKRGINISVNQPWIKVNEQFRPMYTMSDMTQLLSLVNSSEPMKLLEAAQGFRKVLSLEHNPPIQEVIDAGAVPHLIRFIQLFDQPQVQFEAAWALTNISSGTHQNCRVILEKGAVPHLINLLESPSEEVREQTVWVLGNIAGDAAHCRDLILQFGGLPKLITVVQNTNKAGLIKNGAWTISNLCRGKPSPQFPMVKEALPIISWFIHTQEDAEILTDCCWALSHLSDGKVEKVDAVLESGVAKRVIDLLGHALPNVQIPALRVVGNIVTGNEQQTQAMVNLNVLTALLPLLNHEKKAIRKEAVWTYSNVSAGTQMQLNALITADVFPKIISILMNDEFEIKKEAVWAVCNAASVGKAQDIAYLVQHNAIQALSALLNQNDSRILLIAMEGLRYILSAGAQYYMDEQGRNSFAVIFDECGGLDKLEALQKHQNMQVYKKALEIIEANFATEESANDELIRDILAISQQQPAGTLNF